MQENNNGNYTWYTGTVKNVCEGYAFIDIDTVRREDGQASELNTTQDIFLPNINCEERPQKNEKLRFRIAPDHRREGNALVAVGASGVKKEVPTSEHSLASLLGLPTQDTYTGTGIVALPDGTLGPHAGVKPTTQAELDQALANAPLDSMREATATAIPIEPAVAERQFSSLLRQHYGDLAAYGFGFAIQDYDLEQDSERAKKMHTTNKESGMVAQAEKMRSHYHAFTYVRTILEQQLQALESSDQSALQPGTLQSLITLVEAIKSNEPNERNWSISGIVELIARHNLLGPCTVLPMPDLVALFMAAPVWYQVDIGSEQTSEAADQLDLNGWASDLFPTPQWANIFKLFNYGKRSISRYQGQNIPPELLHVMQEATTVFDDVVVMTPYLGRTSHTWGDSNWASLVDPYVVGFRRDLKVFVVLGRVSGMGVFPLLPEMVLDTIKYMDQNQASLDAFRGTEGWRSDPRASAQLTDTTQLLKHVEMAKLAFTCGKLFDWLRGEWNQPAGPVTTQE